MRRYLVAVITLLCAIWVGSNLTTGLTAGLAFGAVFVDDRDSAGAIAGTLFEWQGWIGAGVLGGVVLCLIVLAWRNWQDLLRSRAMGQILVALLVAGLQVAVISVNDVVLQRSGSFDNSVPTEELSAEEQAAKERFTSAHRLGERIYGVETLFLALVMLGGAWHLVRTGAEDG